MAKKKEEAQAALPPDALKAFEMNKSNRVKQHCQLEKDTVIPDSNPYPQFQGKVYKMTTENGKQKGVCNRLSRKKDLMLQVCT
jgi:hypothetical protein